MKTIWLIASGTFGEAMRRKVLLIFLFAGLAIILSFAVVLVSGLIVYLVKAKINNEWPFETKLN